MMNLITSMIPQLLDAATGRHILYEGGSGEPIFLRTTLS
jgi:hypothetical protein